LKKLTILLFVSIFSFFVIGFDVSAENHEDEVNNPVVLTKEQQKEMEKLHNELFETHKKILNKYAEYGVLSKDKVQMKLEHLEEYHQKLKENGYIPDFFHKKDIKDDKHKEENNR
jgi:hypothetical protein